MYIAVADEHGNELPVIRFCITDTPFFMMPSFNDKNHCTFVNGAEIIFPPIHGPGVYWAAVVGYCEDVDGPPLAQCPLEHGFKIAHGQRIAFGRGEIKFGHLFGPPASRKVPQGRPPSVGA